MKRWLAIVVAVGCSGPVTPGPLYDVSGQWAFVGLMQYGESLSCADSFTMRLEQAGTRVHGHTDNWHFACRGVSDSGPSLHGLGGLLADSLVLRWLTGPDLWLCPGCWSFTTFGAVTDTLMRGRYFDWLGGAGGWIAARVMP